MSEYQRQLPDRIVQSIDTLLQELESGVGLSEKDNAIIEDLRVKVGAIALEAYSDGYNCGISDGSHSFVSSYRLYK